MPLICGSIRSGLVGFTPGISLLFCQPHPTISFDKSKLFLLQKFLSAESTLSAFLILSPFGINPLYSNFPRHTNVYKSQDTNIFIIFAINYLIEQNFRLNRVRIALMPIQCGERKEERKKDGICS